jgi:hypothetical protein
MQQTSAPWWKFGHVWLVISGPIVVVIASFVTYYIAARGQDPVLKSEPMVQQQVDAQGRLMPGSLAPAQQARNHAATGVVPVPADKR